MADFPHCSVRTLILELAKIITLDLLGNIDSFPDIFDILDLPVKYFLQHRPDRREPDQGLLKISANLNLTSVIEENCF